MDREEFEKVAQDVFDALPPPFRDAVDNVHIVIEDRPSRDAGARSATGRGRCCWACMRDPAHENEGPPTDVRRRAGQITLYRENIRALARGDEKMRGVIRYAHP